jgi:hypothetical protein
MRLSAGVANELRVKSAAAAASRIRAGDKSDRATVEQALDPRTRMVRGERGGGEGGERGGGGGVREGKCCLVCVWGVVGGWVGQKQGLSFCLRKTRGCW